MTFEQLYTSYYPDVYRFAFWRTNDATQTEDVASETFVRAWARRDHFRTETLKGYLLTIARNVFSKDRQQSANHDTVPEKLPDKPPAPVNPDAQALAHQEARRQIAHRLITLAAVIAFGMFVVAGGALMGAMFLLAR